ncbi:MAG: hypothetical protein R3C11_24275 [Planctomycetaceae bacterium]
MGSLTSGTLSTAGDTHEYTFAGTAGETLLLDFNSAATTDHQITLRGPQGEILLTTNYSSTNVANQISNLMLNVTGTYQLVVSAENSSTGTYEFQMTVRDGLLMHHDVAGTLDTVSSREVFKFSGLAGQNVQIKMDVWGDAADLSYAAGRLSTLGGTEDGYNALDVSLELLDLRENASKHVILITDEDRDNHNTGLSISSIDALLESMDITLHSVVNATIDTTGQSENALGIDGTATTSNAFFADGSGGYTSEESNGVDFVNAFVNTEAHYIDLTFNVADHAGTVWDLNQLRAGGDVGTSFSTALSFSKAFVDVITDQVGEDFYSLILSKTGVDYEIIDSTITETSVSFDIKFTENGASHLFDLEFIQNGDTQNPVGTIPVALTTSYVQLVEDSDFNTTYSDSFTLSSGTTALALHFRDLNFDTTTTNDVNDAFELALVDANGDPVVGSICQGRDSFFNYSEGELPNFGNGVLFETDSASQVSTVTVDVSHLTAGTSLTLIARLVNNDTDTTTSVVLDPHLFQLMRLSCQQSHNRQPG